MARIVLGKINLHLDSATGFPLGQPIGVSYPYLLYYQLHVSSGDWVFGYVAAPVYFKMPDTYAAVDYLIADLRAGKLKNPDGGVPLAAGDVAPDIIVYPACYVVVALSSDDPTVIFDTPPIMLAGHYESEYCGLIGPVNDASNRARIIYFQAPDQAAPAAISYSIYLQYDPGSGTMTQKPIDPKIKNRGGGPPRLTNE